MQKIEFRLEWFLIKPSNRRLLRLINAVDLRGQEVLLWGLSFPHLSLTNLLYDSHKQ